MLGFDKVTKLLERQVIEIAPLAYMRGRRLITVSLSWMRAKIPHASR